MEAHDVEKKSIKVKKEKKMCRPSIPLRKKYRKYYLQCIMRDFNKN